MIFLVTDASLWVARFVPQDAFHPAVKAWLKARRAERAQFLAPGLLLAEVGGAISRKTGESLLGKQVVESLERLPALRLIEMDNSLLREAARLAAQLGLRGADSTYVAVASRLNAPLVTLDTDQQERAARMVEIQTVEH